MKDEIFSLSPELLLKAYATGIFPMSEGRTAPEVFWVDPKRRGVFPLDRYRISRSLARQMRRGDFRVTFDKDFEGVVLGCADRDETWISDRIARLYQKLHLMNYAHSVEIWEGDELIGGVYGVSLGAAFFGESMFSARTNASKIALAYLIDRLRLGGYSLFDTQFLTPHLASLGAVEISRRDYQRQLSDALAARAWFHKPGPVPAPQDVLQRNTQTS